MAVLFEVDIAAVDLGSAGSKIVLLMAGGWA